VSIANDSSAKQYQYSREQSSHGVIETPDNPLDQIIATTKLGDMVEGSEEPVSLHESNQDPDED
jgi:hypothetical protein